MTSNYTTTKPTLPPMFRCARCRMVQPKTVFDVPEADGSTICRACDVADAAWHAEMNWDLRNGARDRG